MSLHAVLVAVPLCLGVAATAVAAIGTMRMRHPLDRLHYVSIACVFSPFLIALAGIAAGVSAQAAIKSVLIALVLALTSPISTHVLARAIRARDTGALAPEDDELRPRRGPPGPDAVDRAG